MALRPPHAPRGERSIRPAAGVNDLPSSWAAATLRLVGLGGEETADPAAGSVPQGGRTTLEYRTSSGWGAAGRGRRPGTGPVFAGALAALLPALGTGAATLAVVGLAGTAFAMGERAVSTATLVIAPLSAPAASGLLSQIRPWAPEALAVFALAWAAALHHLVLVPPSRGADARPGFATFLHAHLL